MPKAKKIERPNDTDTAEAVEVPAEKATGDRALTTAEVAEALNTDPRTLRKFLRDDPSVENAGKGNRYEFRRGNMKSLRKRFADWTKARQAKAEETKTADLETMTVKELKELAAHRKVTVPDKAKKADIIKLLS